MAQFSSVEQLTNLVAELRSRPRASALIGHTVAYTDSDGNAGSGVVDAVTFNSGAPVIDVERRRHRSQPDRGRVVTHVGRSHPHQSGHDASRRRPAPRRPRRPRPGLPRMAPGFDQVLQQRLAATDTKPLRLSGHALERLQAAGHRRRRGHHGHGSARASSKAAAKGSRDALVLVDSTAFVVSVRNRTVITAVGADNMRDRVFTNIDSAVIN